MKRLAIFAVLVTVAYLTASAGARQRPSAGFRLQDAGLADIQQAILTDQITSAGLVQLYLKEP